jgi:hypothetical protein
MYLLVQPNGEKWCWLKFQRNYPVGTIREFPSRRGTQPLAAAFGAHDGIDQATVADRQVAGDHTTVAVEEAVCEAIDAFGECPRGGQGRLDLDSVILHAMRGWSPARKHEASC